MNQLEKQKMETTINQYPENTRKQLQQFNVLFVDNEQATRRNFRNDFCKSNKLFIAASCVEALRILDEIEIHLVIVDPTLKDMCSIEFLQRAAAINPEIVKIMMASQHDTDQIIKAVNTVKIDKYLAKPWKKSELEKIMNEELSRFRPVEPFTIDDLPHLNFQSRIGDEILAENCEVGDPLSDIFRNSFEIKNYPYENQSNFQWVGRTSLGHKVVVLLNMIHLQNGKVEIKRSMSQSLESLVNKNPKNLDSGVLDLISDCYRGFVRKTVHSEKNIPELNTCVLLIHDEEDSIQYFTNYDGMKLFDISQIELNLSASGSCVRSEVSRLFIYSKSFNDHYLGDLTYSQLINESIEMDLERQGHFLEMEILNSPLIAKNVSIVGIELKQKLLN